LINKRYVRNDTFSYSTVTYACMLRRIRNIFVIPPLYFVLLKKYFPSSTLRFQEEGCFLKIPHCRPYVFLVGTACRCRWVEWCWLRNRSIRRISSSNRTFSITYLMLADAWSKLGLCGDWPAANC